MVACLLKATVRCRHQALPIALVVMDATTKCKEVMAHPRALVAILPTVTDPPIPDTRARLGPFLDNTLHYALQKNSVISGTFNIRSGLG